MPLCFWYNDVDHGRFEGGPPTPASRSQPRLTRFIKVIQYQVSGKCIKSASPVLQQVMGALSNGEQEMILLSSFDSEALLILLNILHWRLDKVPRMVSLELLAKITIISGNLGCHGLLEDHARRWMSALRDTIHNLRYSRDLVIWLWLTWAWGLRRERRTASWRLVCQSPGPIPSLGLPFPQDLLRENSQEDTYSISLANIGSREA